MVLIPTLHVCRRDAAKDPARSLASPHVAHASSQGACWFACAFPAIGGWFLIWQNLRASCARQLACVLVMNLRLSSLSHLSWRLCLFRRFAGALLRPPVVQPRSVL